ncbi:MAG TPA: hypothetical protein VFP61_02725 [Acidimicrobiales bacterium]|nr:hypothetical protein [Acidimicrobiales bacterium]
MPATDPIDPTDWSPPGPGPLDGLDPPVADPAPELEEWLVDDPPRGVRLPWVTAVLLAVAVLAAGFWVGAAVQRRDGTSSGGVATAASRFAALRAGSATAAAGGASGARGAPGAGPATAGAGLVRGTVTDVEGSTLYLTDATGALVKVVIGPTTTVSRTAVGAPGALTVGDTATVRGTTGAGGVVTAASVVAVASGVTAGGFGGGFGGAGAGGGGGFGGRSGG